MLNVSILVHIYNCFTDKSMERSENLDADILYKHQAMYNNQVAIALPP